MKVNSTKINIKNVNLNIVQLINENHKILKNRKNI